MKNKPPRCPPLHGVFPTPSLVFPSGGHRRAPFLANDTLLIEPGDLKFQISNLRYQIVQAPYRLPCRWDVEGGLSN